MEWKLDGATDFTSPDETPTTSQKRDCPFTDGVQTESKRFAGQEAWGQSLEPALAAVSSFDDVVDWTQWWPRLPDHHAPGLLLDGPCVPVPPSASTGLSMLENVTSSQAFPGYGGADTTTQLQESVFASSFQDDATLLNIQYPSIDVTGSGGWGWDQQISSPWEDDTLPSWTQSLEQGIHIPGFAELDFTMPLKAGESKTSNPIPRDLALSHTPYSAVHGASVVKTESCPDPSGYPSQQDEYCVLNDGDEGDSQSSELPSAGDNTDTESEGDYDTCFGVVSQKSPLHKISENSKSY